MRRWHRQGGLPSHLSNAGRLSHSLRLAIPVRPVVAARSAIWGRARAPFPETAGHRTGGRHRRRASLRAEGSALQSYLLRREAAAYTTFPVLPASAPLRAGIVPPSRARSPDRTGCAVHQRHVAGRRVPDEAPR